MTQKQVWRVPLIPVIAMIIHTEMPSCVFCLSVCVCACVHMDVCLYGSAHACMCACMCVWLCVFWQGPVLEMYCIVTYGQGWWVMWAGNVGGFSWFWIVHIHIIIDYIESMYSPSIFLRRGSNGVRPGTLAVVLLQ